MRMVVLLAALLLPFAATGAEVAAVPDGGTVVLRGQGPVQLAGIEPAPSPTAAKVLTALALGREVEVEPVMTDRHRRLHAHLRRADGLWIQGEMLRRGLARVRTTPDDRVFAAEMLAIEAEARSAGRGAWPHPSWTVRTPETAARFVDSFQLVEGRVNSAKQVRNQVFLNFGPDRKTDFTVRIDAGALKLFRAAAFDPLTLDGARLRVRGWLRSWDGPLIEVTHPEQVERLP
jgi:endonuclease YncB( thermonuclease family)